MHYFQIRALLNICAQYGLDPEEIDETLTFSEAKDHLLSLVPSGIDTDQAESDIEWYMKEHFLSYYLSARDKI